MSGEHLKCVISTVENILLWVNVSGAHFLLLHNHMRYQEISRRARATWQVFKCWERSHTAGLHGWFFLRRYRSAWPESHGSSWGPSFYIWGKKKVSWLIHMANQGRGRGNEPSAQCPLCYNTKSKLNQGALDGKPNTDFPGKKGLLVLSLPWAVQRGITQQPHLITQQDRI